MSLKDQLKEDMKAAMKAREEGKTALSVIRMVNSAIKKIAANRNAMTKKIWKALRMMLGIFLAFLAKRK